MLIFEWLMRRGGGAGHVNIRMANKGERSMVIIEWRIRRAGHVNIIMAYKESGSC